MDRGLVISKHVNGKKMFLKEALGDVPVWCYEASEIINCSPTDIGLTKATTYATRFGGEVEFEPYQERMVI